MKNVILYLRNQHVLWTDLQRGTVSHEIIIQKYCRLFSIKYIRPDY